MDADVIVVGGGPGGASTARGLALRGVDTLLLERARLPRYKSCAGGISVRTARALDFPLDAVVEDTITGLHISRRGGGGFTRFAREPIVFMVMRDRFDALLVERAAEAGARVVDGVTVRAIERLPEGFQVRAGERTFVARYLVGADGANSVVARALGLGQGLAESVALEAEVGAGFAHRARWRGMLNLDLGYGPWGYAWVFPKERLLSIGAVLSPAHGPRLRDELRGYLQRLGLGAAPIERLVGHKILFRRGRTPIAGEGALLVGDAAGLADEFSAEGIFYAVRSAQLAAGHIARAVRTEQRWLGAYERSVDRQLMPELRAARLLARLFYAATHRAPWLTVEAMRRWPYPIRAVFRVLRGESSYDRELPPWVIPPALASVLLQGAPP